ncbi:MAG: exodeoxyribonuclease VII large subunit, partial [Pseudomonadota bacterium]
LLRAFEVLKQRLDQEGLFAVSQKQALPPHPACLGVVTSPSGAAIHDILTTLRRRYTALPIIVYPVPVQGAGAAEQIADAIRSASRRNECDVLIVARGGGSLEDLWAFNEEAVARAIHECTIPVVTGIGHEVDFTIADFVADQRAATPTAAAELVSPDRDQLQQATRRLFERLQRALTQRIIQQRQTLVWLEKRVQHPGRRLQQIAQRLDDLELRMRNGHRNQWRHADARLATMHERLQRHSPVHRVARTATHCNELERRLQTAMTRYLKDHQAQLGSAGRALDAVSPLATLGRGYAIVTDSASGEILHSSAQVNQGDRIEARLHEGRLRCRVDEVK